MSDESKLLTPEDEIIKERIARKQRKKMSKYDLERKKEKLGIGL